MTNNDTTPEQHEGETDSFLPEHIRELLAEVSNLQKAGVEALTDTLAHWLTAHYVAAAKRAARNAGAKGMDLKTLRGLIADVVALRRGDHSAERLLIEREQLELNRQFSKERMEKLFLEWAMKPENKRPYLRQRFVRRGKGRTHSTNFRHEWITEHGETSGRAIGRNNRRNREEGETALSESILLD